jgi:uncharacterized OB-fold protein
MASALIQGLVLPVDADQTPHLLGGKCGACGAVTFPRMPVCPACRSDEAMSDAAIGAKATLYSHTIARFAPKGFEAPLFQVFVDLVEGPRVFALVGRDIPVEEGQLQDGMPMRLVVEPLADTPENRDTLTYKYVPETAEAAAHA